MYIYTDNPDKVDKISIGSIKYLTRTLDDFVNIYEQNVYMSDEDRQKLELIKEILMYLKHGRFDMLISDPSIIDFNDDDENYFPEYFPI